MGRVGTVVEVEPDGDARLDMGGGDLVTAEHYGDAGDDSHPLPGDSAATVDGEQIGSRVATGYWDASAQKAGAGEKRFYSRDSGGAVVAEIYLKADGSIEITGNAAVKVVGTAYNIGAANQSMLRGQDFFTYMDAVILAVGTAIGGVPVAGTGLKATFDASISAAAPLRAAALSTVIKGE